MSKEQMTSGTGASRRLLLLAVHKVATAGGGAAAPREVLAPRREGLLSSRHLPGLALGQPGAVQGIEGQRRNRCLGTVPIWDGTAL